MTNENLDKRVKKVGYLQFHLVSRNWIISESKYSNEQYTRAQDYPNFQSSDFQKCFGLSKLFDRSISDTTF